MSVNLASLNANLSKVVSTVQSVNAQFNNLNNAANNAGRGVRTFGDKVSTILQFRLIADGINAVKKAITGMVSSIAKYDQALKDLQAITNASSAEVEMMRKRILEISSDSKFSAIEIAQGLKIIGQAGFTATESLEIVDDAAVLARGTLSDMGTVIDLMTTTLRVFRLEAEDSTNVINVYANAINRSKLDVEKLNTAVSYIGPIANAAGVNLEEMTASMMILADAGLRASKIGTGLRRVFAEMVAPGKKLREAIHEAGLSLADIDPTTVSLASALGTLKNVINNAGDAFVLFGKRGALAAIELTSNLDRFKQLTESISESGSAARMAEIQMEGLVDQWTKLKGKIENLGIAIGNSGLADALRGLLKLLNWLADGLTAFLNTGLGKFVIFVTGAVAIVGLLVGAFLLLKLGIVALGAKLALLFAPLAGFFAQLAQVKVLLAALTMIFVQLGYSIEDAFGNMDIAMKTFGATFGKYITYWAKSIELWIAKFAPLTLIWNKIAAFAYIAFGNIVKYFAKTRNTLMSMIKKIPGIGLFSGWIDDLLGTEEAFKDLEKSADEFINNTKSNLAALEAEHASYVSSLEGEKIKYKAIADASAARLPVESAYLKAQYLVRQANEQILKITKEVTEEYSKQRKELQKSLENAAAKAEEFKNAFSSSVEDADKALAAFTKNIEGNFDNIWDTFLKTETITEYEKILDELGKKNKNFTAEMEAMSVDINTKLTKARATGLGKAFEATLGQYDSVISKFNAILSAQRTTQEKDVYKALNNEKELHDKTVLFTNDILKKKIAAADKFTKELDKSLQAALKLEQNYKDALAGTLKSLANSEKERDDILRSLRQEEMTAEEKFYDQKRQFYEKLEGLNKTQKTDAKQALSDTEDLIKEAQNFRDLDGKTTTAQRLIIELTAKKKEIL